LRIFNAYGPGQPLPASHAPVVPRFLQAITSGGSVVIFGEGRQSRDFVYLADVVEALVKASTAAEVNRKVLNIGSGHETTVAELIAIMEQLCGRPANLVYNREKSTGVDRLVADIGQAQQSLRFVPKVSLRNGLEQMMREDPRFATP
jgi:UDP-glucose 4-epimerase